MTYKEFEQEIQKKIRLYGGYVEGYSTQQERMANRPCHEAIENCKLHNKLTIIRSTGAGRFYDIYATVVGQMFNIGYMCNNGTIQKHLIEVHLDKVDKYGDMEVIWALLELAKDFFITVTDRLSERLAQKEAEMKSIQSEIDANYNVIRLLNNEELKLKKAQNG